MQRPWVTAAALAATACIVVSVGGGAREFSTIRDGVLGLPVFRGPHHPQYSRFRVIERDGHVTVMNPDGKGEPGTEGDLWSLAAEGKIVLVDALYYRLVRYTGLLGLTTRTVTHELQLIPADGAALSPDTRAVVEAAILKFARDPENEIDPRAVAEMNEYLGSRSETLVGGYIVNALAVTALGIAVFSAGWIPRVPAQRRLARRRARLAKGVCPGCQYSLAGLETPAPERCPECGESLKAI